MTMHAVELSDLQCALIDVTAGLRMIVGALRKATDSQELRAALKRVADRVETAETLCGVRRKPPGRQPSLTMTPLFPAEEERS
jgi:hypothetical protein